MGAAAHRVLQEQVSALNAMSIKLAGVSCKDKQLSIPVFTIAILLAGAPVHLEGAPPEAPALISAPVASDQAVPDPAAPVAAPEQALPAAPEPAPLPAEAPAPAQDLPTEAPAPDPAADPSDPNAIIVTARQPAPHDPLQSVNAEIFGTVQAIDTALVGPAAMTYKRAVPGPVRSGLRNFFNNLQEPVVFLNYLLQIKPGKAVETLGRFTINSTIGVAGLVDVAKKRPFKLPRRPNGFGYTLGYYGLKPGPYMYLPLIGPTTTRDLFGRWVDLLVLPLAVGQPFNDPLYSISAVVIRSLDERAEADEALRKLREESADPYVDIREAYLRTRQAEIDALRGRPGVVINPTPRRFEPAPARIAPPIVPGLPDLSGQVPDLPDLQTP